MERVGRREAMGSARRPQLNKHARPLPTLRLQPWYQSCARVLRVTYGPPLCRAPRVLLYYTCRCTKLSCVSKQQL